jgi:hypothetical protein
MSVSQSDYFSAGSFNFSYALNDFALSYIRIRSGDAEMEFIHDI